MTYYEFMDRADAWTEQEGWLGWLITGWHKLASYFDDQTILSSFLYIIIILQIFILLNQHRNLTQIKSTAFWKGWRAKEIEKKGEKFGK